MTFSSDQSPIREGEVIDDKYVVERVIGIGGMGVVAAARHAELGQQVALKFMLPQALVVPGAVERFMREARSAVQLQSQHVARVYDVGRIEGGAPFLVMELLHGCDLGSLVKRSGPLRVGDAVEYLIQACEAVAEAHALGIVHRDLKPANLFLTRRINGAPLVKVLDFGISKITNLQPTDPSLTKTSDVVGSPYYMAPEQVRSARDVDARTDIWALGVILYELLAGEVPFQATNVPQLCAKVLEVEPAPLHHVRPEIPERLSQVVATCLGKRPEQRYASVQDLVRALAPFASVGLSNPPVAGPSVPLETVADLPPVPVRSSMTLGETMQQGVPPAGVDGAVPAGVGARSGQHGASTSARLGWDNGSAASSARRPSWLFVAVPVLALTALIVLGLAIWTVLRGDGVGDGSALASGAAASGSALGPGEPGESTESPDAKQAPLVVVSASASASSSSDASSVPGDRTGAPPVPTAPAVTTKPEPTPARTAVPLPTKTTAPAGTGTIDDFLPSDRK